MGNSKSKRRKKANNTSVVATPTHQTPQEFPKQYAPVDTNIIKLNQPAGFTQNEQNGFIFVMGYIRQKIEKYLQSSPPIEIKEMIYAFWGKWINLQIGDIVYTKAKNQS